MDFRSNLQKNNNFTAGSILIQQSNLMNKIQTIFLCYQISSIGNRFVQVKLKLKIMINIHLNYTLPNPQIDCILLSVAYFC